MVVSWRTSRRARIGIALCVGIAVLAGVWLCVPLRHPCVQLGDELCAVVADLRAVDPGRVGSPSQCREAARMIVQYGISDQCSLALDIIDAGEVVQVEAAASLPMSYESTVLLFVLPEQKRAETIGGLKRRRPDAGAKD